MHYSSIEDFASDVRLVFTNAKTYNMEFSDIHQMAKLVEAHFEDKLNSAFKGVKKRSGDGAVGAAKKPKTDDVEEDELSDVSHELPEEPTEEEKARPVTLD